MILTVTLNPALDHTVQIGGFPENGEIVRTDDADVQAGGKGINVSQYLAALGAETVATGVVGGAFGRFIESELDDCGVANDFVRVDANTRVNTTILTGDGQYKINQRGPTVGADAFDALLATIERHDPEVVVVAGSNPRGIEPSHVDRIARAGPWRTAVDVGGPTLRQLDAEYALCNPNETELAAAAEMATETIEGACRAAEALQQRGFERVVASLGDRGAIMATADGTFHALAPDADVVDTVGAGDSLLAGVLAAFVRGDTAADALRSGVAVASRAVEVAGTSIPSLDGLAADRDRVTVSERN